MYFECWLMEFVFGNMDLGCIIDIDDYKFKIRLPIKFWYKKLRQWVFLQARWAAAEPSTKSFSSAINQSANPPSFKNTSKTNSKRVSTYHFHYCSPLSVSTSTSKMSPATANTTVFSCGILLAKKDSEASSPITWKTPIVQFWYTTAQNPKLWPISKSGTTCFRITNVQNR